MNSRILVVEDDEKLSKLIAEYLKNQGHSVEIEGRGDKAIYRILHENYNIVILDVKLPGLNGLQICKLVRQDFTGYILILTAAESDEDHILGLEYGADDFLNKPIQPKVLSARIQSLHRRQPSSSVVKQLNFGNLSIDLEKREVKLKNKAIDLKPSEYELLALLAGNAGISLTRDNIMHALRGIDYDGTDRTIDLRISYLRNKLEDDITTPYRIKTVRKKGYVFLPDAWEN